MAKTNQINAGGAAVTVGVVDKTSAQLKKIGTKFRAWGAGISSAGLKVAGAGLAMVSSLFGTAKVFAAMGDEINKASQRTGVAVTALSELKYAAEQSGLSFESLEGGLKRMQKTLFDAAGGSKSAKESLAMLGLTVADLASLSPDKQFEAIAEKIAQIEDPAVRAALAMEIFGKSGTDLIPLMADGAAGIQALRKRAEQLGLTMSKKDAEAATKFGDALGDLWMVLKAVTFNAGAAVARFLQPWAEKAVAAAAATSKWVKANGPLIVTAFKVAAGILAAGVAVVALGGAVTVAGIALGGIAAVLGVILSPMAALVAALVYAAHTFFFFSDTGAAAIDWLSGKFFMLAGDAKTAFGGIADALAGGEIQLAAKILWAVLKLEFQRGIGVLQGAWHAFGKTFVGTAFAILYGVRVYWENMTHGIAVAFVEMTSFMGKAWAVFAATFKNLWISAQQVAFNGMLDLQVAAGQMSQQTADTAKKAAASAMAYAQNANATSAGSDIAANEAARIAARKGLDEQHARERGRADSDLDDVNKHLIGNADAAMAATQAEIDQLRAELQALRSQAGGGESGGLGGPNRPTPPNYEDIASSLGDIAKNTGTAKGTFNASVAGALGENPAQATAKNTKVLADWARRNRDVHASFA